MEQGQQAAVEKLCGSVSGGPVRERPGELDECQLIIGGGLPVVFSRYSISAAQQDIAGFNSAVPLLSRGEGEMLAAGWF